MNGLKCTLLALIASVTLCSCGNDNKQSLWTTVTNDDIESVVSNNNDAVVNVYVIGRRHEQQQQQEQNEQKKPKHDNNGNDDQAIDPFSDFYKHFNVPDPDLVIPHKNPLQLNAGSGFFISA